MRRVTLSLFAVFSLFLIGCSDDDGTETDLGRSRDPSSSIISLKAEVQSSTEVKAGPINSSFSTDFPIGIYAYKSAWLAGSVNVINNDSATVAGAAGHNITFAHGPYYYPADGTTLNFFAFSPQAAESTAAGAGTSPVVTHTITGQEDVMWTSSTGSKVGSAPATAPVLNFAHKLTQLQFTFQSDTTYPASGNSVTSLTVNAQPNTVLMNVETGVCTFSGSMAMQALSTANQSSGIGITTAGANANSPVMTNAGTSYSLTIIVKPAGSPAVTYTNVPVTLTTTAGSAHMITLKFTETAVTATATVAAWVTGTGGNVTVL
ncbi:fimbrillin family protein [Dysgonomonas sp. ZJ279]|uniref:fimbrillin family protein n=1 Tax=Dysgonomonas sp. ZJ279 TaxID=2709796 RepID=UPI0013EC7569|nr:fimbrillin family protein [Dysgonomonas sp. ZJ279]